MANTYGNLISDDLIAQGLAQVKPKVSAAWLTAYVPALETALETYLHRKLAYDAAIVEWPEVSDDQYLILDTNPVLSVSEVRVDQTGGYGQVPDTFGADTVLTAGVDYFLKLDGKGAFAGASMTGLLFRRGRSWGYSRNWKQGLLASSREPVAGTIKVTYAGGYTAETMPKDLQTGVVKALSILYQTLPFVGPVGSEMIGGYNYSKTIGAELEKHQFAEVRQFIGGYRRLRVGGGGTNS